MVVVVLIAVAVLFLLKGASSGVAVAPAAPTVATAAALEDPSARSALATASMGWAGFAPVFPTNQLVAPTVRGRPPITGGNPPAVSQSATVSGWYRSVGLPVRSSGGF
jgi:hypothetical protein